jgi:hypothetical protein
VQSEEKLNDKSELDRKSRSPDTEAPELSAAVFSVSSGVKHPGIVRDSNRSVL